jgi:hypothetical protein
MREESLSECSDTLAAIRRGPVEVTGPEDRGVWSFVSFSRLKFVKD